MINKHSSVYNNSFIISTIFLHLIQHEYLQGNIETHTLEVVDVSISSSTDEAAAAFACWGQIQVITILGIERDAAHNTRSTRTSSTGPAHNMVVYYGQHQVI